MGALVQGGSIVGFQEVGEHNEIDAAGLASGQGGNLV
jgi:hypothetical protein